MESELHILRLAARTRLDPDGEERLVELLRGPVNWDQLWRLGHIHDVLPLLTTTLRALQPRVSPPDDWMARAQRRLYATLMHNTVLADELVRVCGALAAAGVESLPVKGVVLAETLYGNLALRPAADLDVLVRPTDLPAARVVLRELGFAHGDPQAFVQQHHHFHDPQYFRRTAAGELCLELHWALWAARFFHLAPDALWERAVSAQVHGARLRILSPEDTLLHLAIDFDEEEMVDLLLAHGAEVNARANVDAEGFGGHAPIYNAVVSHGKRRASMARLAEVWRSVMARVGRRGENGP